MTRMKNEDMKSRFCSDRVQLELRLMSFISPVSSLSVGSVSSVA